MPDENPASPNPSEASDKSETIRITLPASTETPVSKRETVRINIPEPAGSTPKKETSKVNLPVSGAVPPPPPLTRPSAPPAPPPLTKPISGTTPPPKPPPLGTKPTIPLKPAPSGAVPAPSPAAPAASGIVAKPASPKKETARISLPTEAPKSSAPALPKATVKMQATQPLAKAPSPASGIRQSLPSGTTSGALKAASATSIAPVVSSSPAKSDTLGIVLSILAFLGATAAGVFSFLIYQSVNHPTYLEWVTK